MSNNKKTIKIILAVIVALIIGTLIVTMVNKEKTTTKEENKIVEKNKTNEKNTNETKEKDVEKETPKKPADSKKEEEELTKEAAANKLADMMNELYDKHGKDLIKVSEKLSQDPTKWNKVVDKAFIEKYLRTVDILDQEEIDGISVAGMGVVTNSVKSVTKEGPIKLDKKLVEAIFLDKDMKIAYVPMDVYTNKTGILSIEMVYDENNEWKVMPYSMIQQAIAVGMQEENTKGE